MFIFRNVITIYSPYVHGQVWMFMQNDDNMSIRKKKRSNFPYRTTFHMPVVYVKGINEHEHNVNKMHAMWHHYWKCIFYAFRCIKKLSKNQKQSSKYVRLGNNELAPTKSDSQEISQLLYKHSLVVIKKKKKLNVTLSVLLFWPVHF